MHTLLVDWSLVASIATALAALAGVIVAAWFTWASARVSARHEAEERQRLNSEVFGRLAFNRISDADLDSTMARLAQQAEEHPTQVRPAKERSPSRDEVYDQLLVNDYALGLTQARMAFNISMAFSIVGGLVLVLGVGLAIFRADTGGQVAGAAITSAAGVLTSGLSQLFRGQSTKALKHLESQAVELRKDVRSRTNAATAQQLLGEVRNDDLRSRLQAALILEFTGAKLPDFDTSAQLNPGALNGNIRSSEVTGSGAVSS